MSKDPRGRVPLDHKLKRALFEDIDSFYEPWQSHNEKPEQHEDFVAFSHRLATGALATLDLSAVGVRFVWLGSKSGAASHLQVIKSACSALVAPAQVDADVPGPATALGRAATLLAGSPPGGSVAPTRAIHGRALLDALSRHAVEPRGGTRTALAVGITDGDIVNDQNGVVISMIGVSLLAFHINIDLADPNRHWHQIAWLLNCVLRALGLQLCYFYICLLNPGQDYSELRPFSFRLCPVCLRKLGALLGSRWSVELHYQALIDWLTDQGLR